MNMKRILAVVLALTLSLAALLPALAEDEVVMTVNGVKVTKAQLDIYAQMFGETYGVDPADESIVSYALNYLLQGVFIEQKSAELNLSLTDEEKASCQTEWETTVQAYADSLLTSEEPTEEEKAQAYTDALAAAEAQDFTVEMLELSLLSEKLMNELIKDVTVTEEDAKTVYDAYVAEDTVTYGGEDGYANYEYMVNYGPMMEMYGMGTYREPYVIPEGIRGITHILLAVDEALLTEYNDAVARLEEAQDATEAETTEEPAETTEEPQEPVTQEDIDALEAQILASVQTTVDEINQKLQNGASFDDLIKEYGTDGGMNDEATLATGYGVHKDSETYDLTFRDEAFNQLEKIGDVSAPVVTQFGVHILCYKSDFAAGPVPFENVKDALMEEALVNAQNEVITQVVTQWQNDATIVLADGYSL